jgi:DNA-binding transcriptional LysR family regulator
MEVRQLNTLIRAAQFQSFSKAAESLGYSQSAVTVQIKALEEELGVRLFDRMGKRVILTAQGQCFLEYANSILDTIHNARRALSEDAELEGCLHIGTLESLCFFRLPGLMHQFRVEHPKVSLRVTTGSPEELIEKMERGEVDLICILDEPTPTAGTSATRCRRRWCSWLPRTSTSATPARTG